METPKDWLKQLVNIRKVRQKYPAPVDTMGCDQASQSKSISDKDKRFHCLVSLMLSSQTKDPITWAALQRLRDNGLGNVESMKDATEKDIEDLIYPAGFYKRKAIYLKKTAQILHEQYGGEIPDSVEDLCKLPGVGPKMAHLCMSSAWDEVSGIGVDVHVHRISARLGWVPKTGVKTPEDTRKALESWLPKDYWREINHLLVGFGQTICTPLRPKCDQCFNNNHCPSSRTKTLNTKIDLLEESPQLTVPPVKSKPAKKPKSTKIRSQPARGKTN